MVGTRRRSGFTREYPLFCALAKGDHARVTELCRQGQAAAVCGPGNFSALHVCALTGNAASIATLLTAGAPLDAALVLWHDSPELAKWLHTARQEVGDKWPDGKISKLTKGSTALGVALQLWPTSQPVAKALLDAGADVWEQLLLHAPYFPLAPAEYARQPWVLWVLGQLASAYTSGALMLSSERLGLLARLALAAGDMPTCEGLLRTAASQQQQLRLSTVDAHFLLAGAVEEGHSGVVRELLRLGVSPGIEVAYDKPAVVKAAELGSSAIMGLLLAAGAAITRELVKTVIKKARPELLRILLQHWPLPTFTTDAAGSYDCLLLRLLCIRPRVGGQPGGWRHAVHVCVLPA
jgi:hypothetical protein